MNPLTIQLARLFDLLWALFMGLFLGLAGGLVLAVILTFAGARQIQASPGIEPFNSARFATYASDSVAGYIGQKLFMVGGSVALVLLGLALLARVLHGLIMMVQHRPVVGSPRLSTLRWLALLLCVVLMLAGASLTIRMNASWPGLYDTQASGEEITQRREAFDNLHQRSERLVGAAWFCGLLSLVVSPWCRRPADGPLATEPTQKQ